MAILFVIGWLYPQLQCYDEYLWNESDQIHQVSKAKNCEIVYTSASSNFSQPGDTDERKISQFIDNCYPELALEAFNRPASHVGIHSKYLAVIPEENKIRTVVCAINLRSFGVDWRYSELESKLNKELVMFEDRPAILNRFLVSLNAYENPSANDQSQSRLSEWDQESLPYPYPRNTVNNWCAEEKWGDWKDPKRQLADQFIKQYAFLLREENPRVGQLDQLVELIQNRGWNCVLTILPENIEKADSLVGKELTSLMKSNAEWITSRYKNKEGVSVLNNIQILPSKYFTDKDFPTEHYNSDGRKLVALYAAYALKRFHKNDFVNPQWDAHLNIGL